ncbi:MAG: amidohydrolase family protein [Candidatus Hydrogenedentes bacterium]|nr:amidohydrolase family protein [Candidatus Hydrogenedentota bacterium]
MFDILIRNGTIVDGTGKTAFQADVGIEGDAITLVGTAGDASAVLDIDAAGKHICPGFIDSHSHADISLYRENSTALLEPLVRQGITTFVGGNCGMAMAPLGDTHRDAVQAYINIFTRIDFDTEAHWQSMGDYFEYVENKGLLLNAAILAPHGVLRLNAMGMEPRSATPDEITIMQHDLAQALDEGAIGLSTGLQYMPGSHSDRGELLALGEELHRQDGIFTSHLRSYSKTLDRAIDEVIEVGEHCDIPVQISHLFLIPDYGVFGPLLRSAIRGMARLSKYWVPPIPIDQPMAKRLKQISDARKRGVKISTDIMPSTTGFTHVLAFFPPWSVAGTVEDVLNRLRDPEQRKRIRHSIEHGKMEWPHTAPDTWSLNLFQLMGWECARIMSVSTEKNKRLEGMPLVDIARERVLHPFDALCDLLLEENGQVLAFESLAEPGDAFTERSTFAGLAHPDVMISTDSILMGSGKPSPLFYGCYPRYISRYVRDKKLLSLESAIHKMSGLPAEHFNLRKRGHIAAGAYADVIVFDYNTIGTQSTFEDPAHFPEGIEHVFINGHHVVDGTTFNPDPLPGQLLRKC